MHAARADGGSSSPMLLGPCKKVYAPNTRPMVFPYIPETNAMQYSFSHKRRNQSFAPYSVSSPESFAPSPVSTILRSNFPELRTLLALVPLAVVADESASSQLGMPVLSTR